MKRADFALLPRGYDDKSPGLLILAGPRRANPTTKDLVPVLQLCAYSARLGVKAEPDGWRVDTRRLSDTERRQIIRLAKALVTKAGDCRWPEDADAIPLQEIQSLRDRLARETGLVLDSLIRGDKLDLHYLADAAPILVLILDAACSWYGRPMPDQSLLAALEEAKGAIAASRRAATIKQAQPQHRSMEAWLALEMGDRDRAQLIASELTNEREARSIRVALAWLSRDSHEAVQVGQEIASNDPFQQRRLDGTHGESVCWDGFLRLAIADSGSVWQETAWLGTAQLSLPDTRLGDDALQLLRRGCAPGNSPSINAACEVLLFWNSLLHLKQARFSGEEIQALAEVPSLKVASSILLPGPFRAVLQDLSEIAANWGVARDGEGAEELAVVEEAPPSEMDEEARQYQSALERGELELWEAIVRSPARALERAREYAARMAEHWGDNERLRAARALFLLSVRAEDWQSAASELPAAVGDGHRLSSDSTFQEALWLLVENLPWDAPDGDGLRRISLPEQVTGSQVQAIRIWSRFITDPVREAPWALSEIASVTDVAMRANSIRQRLSLWWLGHFSQATINDPTALEALVSAYQLVGDEVSPSGQREIGILESLALTWPMDRVTNVSESWLQRWLRRLEGVVHADTAAKEWPLFSAHFREIWRQMEVGESAFWAWADCQIAEYERFGRDGALEECAIELRESVNRLGSASRLLDLFERLVDRVESGARLSKICQTTADWLRRAAPTSAALPFQAGLVKVLRQTSAQLGLGVPDIADLGKRFQVTVPTPASGYMGPSPRLRGKSVVVVGGRPATFVRLRDVLTEEDGMTSVLHLPAGEATGPKVASVKSADLVLLVTTYMGHDDQASVEKAIANQADHIVRLKDRRDGALTLVQVVRRAAQSLAN